MPAGSGMKDPFEGASPELEFELRKRGLSPGGRSPGRAGGAAGDRNELTEADIPKDLVATAQYELGKRI